MTQNVGRNDPCPCGSGKKYKNCHGAKTSVLGRPGGTPLWALLLMIVAGVVVIVLGYRFMNRGSALPERMPQAGAPVAPGGPPAAGDPAPYTYDAHANRHWDPTHRHWHDGPPPAGAAGAAGAAGTPTTGPQPSPWTYDPKTGQHWDPSHGHWHQGPPPPAEARGTPIPRDTTP